jgi:Fe-S-cluster containining protein
MKSEAATQNNLLDALVQMYAEVDALSNRLAQTHSARLRCGRGCSACCVDDLTVYQIEAENIRLHHTEFLETATPHKKSACAFLDEEGSCRIYEQRPYVCRTQGLPLRWFEETEDDEIVELRDICPLNEEGEPIENLKEEECWTIGTFEARLADLQHEFDDGMKRVALRDLFKQ